MSNDTGKVTRTSVMDLGDEAIDMIASGLAGNLPKRPDRVIPEDWITYRGLINKDHEIGLVRGYDKTEKAELPEHLRDDFVKVMESKGYKIHEFSSNKSAGVVSNSQTANDGLKFDVYLIGYFIPRLEGEKLKDVFRRLAGINIGNRSEDRSVIDDRFSIAIQSVIGEGQICFGGESHGDIADQIKGYCYRKGLNEIKGNEDPVVIERTLELARYIRELRKDIDRYKKMGPEGTAKKHELRIMQEWVADESFRLFHERSRNTHTPIIERFLSSRQGDQRLIGIYSPDHFRKDTFMGGYKQGAFDEPSYQGGLREACARQNANYITFMRPSSELNWKR